ncbi:MAG: helix-turn-helix transcriptional regulator [Pseudomonadota bacterium]
MTIARELGADALNVARFKGDNHTPIWIRISTHELASPEGLRIYVENDFMSVDPVLTPRAVGSLKEVDVVSLEENIKNKELTEKELACHRHLLQNGQSIFLSYRIFDQASDEETLVVFACSSEGLEKLRETGEEKIEIIANLFSIYIGPPTPQQSDGKVPLLYNFLTKQEKKVLSCLAQGLQNAEIAHRLNISEATVRLHTIGARKKMNATTRTQAVALAMVRGLLIT